jgi:hypothetical protein
MPKYFGIAKDINEAKRLFFDDGFVQLAALGKDTTCCVLPSGRVAKVLGIGRTSASVSDSKEVQCKTSDDYRVYWCELSQSALTRSGKPRSGDICSLR